MGLGPLGFGREVGGRRQEELAGRQKETQSRAKEAGRGAKAGGVQGVM